MKYLIFLLPILVACNGGGGSNKGSYSNSLTISSDVKTNVNVYGDEFIISDYLPERKSMSSCGLNPGPGKRYTYKVTQFPGGVSLVIHDEDGRRFIYETEHEYQTGLSGKWFIEHSEQIMLSESYIEFSDDLNTVHIVSKCFRD